jgi:hypothetical protein
MRIVFDVDFRVCRADNDGEKRAMLVVNFTAYMQMGGEFYLV